MKKTLNLLFVAGLLLSFPLARAADPSPFTVWLPDYIKVQAGGVTNGGFSIQGGPEPLDWSASIEPAEAAEWIRVIPASGTVGAYETVRGVLSYSAVNKQKSAAAIPFTFKLHSPGYQDRETPQWVEIGADGTVGSYPENIGLVETPKGMVVTNTFILWNSSSVPIYNWKFTVTNSSGALCPWLTITPGAGAVLTNNYDNRLELTVAADTSSLAVGVYSVTAVFSAQNLSSAQKKSSIIKTITLSVSAPKRLRVQLHQRISLPGAFGSATTNEVRAEFTRVLNGTNRIVLATVLHVTPTNVVLRVPPSLVAPDEALPENAREDSPVSIRLTTTLNDRTVVNDFPNVDLAWPRRLIHDEVFVPPLWPAGLAPQWATSSRTLLQFTLNDPRHENDATTLATFVFSGQAVNGMAGLRVLNSASAFPAPLRLDGQVSVFEPDVATGGLQPVSPFTFFNTPFGSGGLKFNIRRDGLHLIVVEAQTNSPGPFPAPFQIHLAGNMGAARKVINGAPEPPRATRREVLFNHPAPQTVRLGGAARAETAVLKFANLVEVSPYPVAVLIPPDANGFVLGNRPVRAGDPAVPLEVTTPTAPAPAALQVGAVIDMTQIPVPASPAGTTPIAGTLSALFGGANAGFALPFTAANGTAVQSIILDFGSGNEIVDGRGNDLSITSATGSYRVAVGNSPYADDLRVLGGTLTGNVELDLASTGLTSARYVRINALSSVTLSGIKALNQFADEVQSNIGPVVHSRSGSLLVRREKATANLLDPFIQLIAPDGEVLGENESSFGDDTSQDRSDAALLAMSFSQDGFYRCLVKGYDQTPDEQAFGGFSGRLETAGVYDPVELVVSDRDEAQCAVQKTGTISQPRQRDSYLLQAVPGARLSLSVTARMPGQLDPLVELYDPEDFLIAANDNYEDRGRNAALTVTLPPTSVTGAALPVPSTYRIVISACDRLGAAQSWTAGQVYLRQGASGSYDLKVFTGQLASPSQPDPVLSSIDPPGAAPGTAVLIRGANFSTNLNEITVLFGSTPALVSSATLTSITATVPATLPDGPVAVTVRVAGRTSPPATFTITPPAATRAASVRLDCLSVKIQPATVPVAGQPYTLALTSGFDPAAPNGELYPSFEWGSFSHSSSYVLAGPDQPVADMGQIDLDIPANADADGNGIIDFFEIGKAIAPVTTEGLWANPDAEGLVQATWSRPAGSARGACRLQFLGTTPAPLPDLETSFELLEYSGTLEYLPATNRVSGSIALVESQSPSNTVSGAVVLVKNATNRFNQLVLDAGSWTNTAGRACAYAKGALSRDPAHPAVYTGQLAFLNSPIPTEPEAYLDWQFTIVDINDTNQNGVPDLSDDPQPGTPQLVLTAVGFTSGHLSFRINAPLGSQVDLEQTTSLRVTDWTTAASLTISQSPQEIRITPLPGPACFYRLRLRP